MLDKRLLATILILFLTVFVLFMSLIAYSGILLSGDVENARQGMADAAGLAVDYGSAALEIAADAVDSVANAYRAAAWSHAPETVQRADVNAKDTLFASADTRRVAILSGGDGAAARRVREWCGYVKARYRAFDELPEASALESYSVLIFADYPLDASCVPTLRTYAASGITMLFTTLPDYETLAASAALRDIFGIREAVDPAYPVDGVHIYADFYLSTERIYREGDYIGQEDDMPLSVPFYSLRSGHEVYVAAHIADIPARGLEIGETPPLCWRTVTDASQVFVIGSDLFAGEALPGTLSALLARASGVCVYPVVNAKTVTILNYPWLSVENADQISGIYGHKPDTLSLSVMWPGVIQSLYGYDKNTNFFTSARLDYAAEGDESQSEMLTSYFAREIMRRLGTLSLTLSQESDVDLDALLTVNAAFFERYLPAYRFTSLYAGAFDRRELAEHLAREDGLLSDVTLALFSGGEDPVLSYIADDVLAVRMTTDGLRYETRDDVQTLAQVTGLGLINQYVDLSSTLYPQTADDSWNTQSIRWSSAATYFADFDALDYLSVYEMEDRARAFLGMDYSYASEDGALTIHLQNAQAGCFVVRLFNDEITSVSGGEYVALTPTAYLVKAEADTVRVFTEPRDWLDQP